MAVIPLSGIDLEIKVNGVAIGCASDINVSLTTAMSSAACRQSGGWASNVPGQHSWTADTSGIIRLATGGDKATNRTFTDLVGLQIARTPVAVEFGSAISGDTKYTGTAYISDTKPTSPLDGAATFSVSLVGDGPLVPSVNP
jgi:predicted secreted protein